MTNSLQLISASGFCAIDSTIVSASKSGVAITVLAQSSSSTGCGVYSSSTALAPIIGVSPIGEINRIGAFGFSTRLLEQ